MNGNRFKILEFIVLFLILPSLLFLNIPIWLKAVLVICGLAFVLYIMTYIENLKFFTGRSYDIKSFIRDVTIRFMLILILSTILAIQLFPSKMFNVIEEKPFLWLLLIVVYSLLSVIPQEFVFRKFYFKRYGSVFTTSYVMIFTNALVFSYAHIFFKNGLVLFITFLGGLLFALTYYKYRSTLLVSIEHALYGCWIFTLGMGDMLGFPV